MHDARHDPSQPLDIYRIALPDALHPLSDIAELRAELAELRREQASILEAIQRHADALQVLLLRGETG